MTQRRQEEPFDVAKLDPAAQKAFQYAVDFYEKDKALTPNQRGLLASTYSGISSFTLAFGWGTFFAVTSVPFYRQKFRTGSTKGTNVGIAILFGMGGMMLASPYGASKAYNWQLEKLREQDQQCYEVAEMLKPAESAKWWMYYKLTKDHPEHIMKDPRSKEAEEQRKKTLYTGRDPLGLYSGPRAEMNRRRVETLPDADAASAESTQSEPSISTPIDEDDPFAEQREEEKIYASAWEKVRDSKGISSPQPTSSWGRVRSQPSPSQQTQQQNPYTTNVYRPTDTNDQSDMDQSDFDKLLEQERRIGEENDKKWS